MAAVHQLAARISQIVQNLFQVNFAITDLYLHRDLRSNESGEVLGCGAALVDCCGAVLYPRNKRSCSWILFPNVQLHVREIHFIELYHTARSRWGPRILARIELALVIRVCWGV